MKALETYLIFKKFKVVLSTFLLLIVISTVNAQIENEILSFVDSTELLVNNGRRLLLQHVQAKDYSKVTEIYDFLNEKANARNCAAFTYNEELFISILTNNWNNFLTKAEHFSETVQVPYCIAIRDQLLSSTLHLEVKNNALLHLKNALTTDLTLEDKELLGVYFHIIENGRDNYYGTKLKEFKKKYPQSRYSDFVNKYLPDPLFTFGMAFSMGATQIFPTGNLSNYFVSSTVFNVSMDFYFNNFLLGLQVNGGSLDLKTPMLSQSTGYGHDFQKNDRFSYVDGGVLGGYILLKNNWLQFTPFVMLGGTTLESKLYKDPNDSKLEFKITNSFTVGFGLRSEISVIKFKMRDPYFASPMPSRINLRLDAGYNIPVKYSYTPAKGNIPYVRMALVWWFGNTF